MEKKIVKFALEHPDLSYSRLAAELNQKKVYGNHVHKKLLIDIFKRHQIIKRLSQPHPKLTLQQMQSRIKYAKENLNRNWDNAVFLDETRIRIGAKPGRNTRYYTTIWGEPIAHAETIKHGPYVDIVACVGLLGASKLHFVEGNMNSEKFVESLKKSIVPELRKVYGDNFIIVMDNDRKHTSVHTKSKMEEMGVNVLWLPVNSPDLNIIENVWSSLKDDIENKCPHDKHSLMDILKKSWKVVSKPDCMIPYYTSLKDRLKEVIKVKGASTHY